jgi:hypothetical protein
MRGFQPQWSWLWASSVTMNSLQVGSFMLAIFVSTILSYQFGAFYAAHIAGNKCGIVIKDGRFEKGTYLRFVGEGHLIRSGARVYFVPKDQVKKAKQKQLISAAGITVYSTGRI